MDEDPWSLRPLQACQPVIALIGVNLQELSAEALKERLGSKSSMVIAEASYEVTDSTVDSQIVKLKSAGADVLYDVATPKFAAQAIKRVAELGWKPLHVLSTNATSVSDVMLPAGAENSKGVVSVNYLKDPLDPQWANDAGMKRFKAFMVKYFPDGDSNSTYNAYAYVASELMVEILKRSGEDLSRENILKQVTSLKDVTSDILLPGITLNSTADDYRFIKQLQMMRFNGERWEIYGALISDEANN